MLRFRPPPRNMKSRLRRHWIFTHALAMGATGSAGKHRLSSIQTSQHGYTNPLCLIAAMVPVRTNCQPLGTQRCLLLRLVAVALSNVQNTVTDGDHDALLALQQEHAQKLFQLVKLNNSKSAGKTQRRTFWKNQTLSKWKDTGASFTTISYLGLSN